MSYRQSSYDPLAGPVYGPPLRPYDAKQWIGVAMVAAGMLFFLAFLVGQAGLVRPVAYQTLPMSVLMLSGSALINSRRREIPPEERDAFRARQRRNTWLGLGIAVAAGLIGLAVVALSRIG